MTDYRPRLNDTQREQARRRWEGSAEQGFTQLAAECHQAWGVVISRQALLKAARKGGWVKRGQPSEPLAQMPTLKPAPALGRTSSRIAAVPVPRVNDAGMVALRIIVKVAHGAKLRACPPGK